MKTIYNNKKIGQWACIEWKNERLIIVHYQAIMYTLASESLSAVLNSSKSISLSVPAILVNWVSNHRSQLASLSTLKMIIIIIIISNISGCTCPHRKKILHVHSSVLCSKHRLHLLVPNASHAGYCPIICFIINKLKWRKDKFVPFLSLTESQASVLNYSVNFIAMTVWQQKIHERTLIVWLSWKFST